MQIGPGSLTASARYVPGVGSARPAQVPSPSFSGALTTAAEAASDPDRYAPNNSTLSHLTPADRELIAASTGVRIGSDGAVINPTSTQPVDRFIAIMAADRMYGALQGPVTSEYLVNLFDKYEKADMPLNPQFLDNALDFLRSRDDRQHRDAARSRSIDLAG